MKLRNYGSIAYDGGSKKWVLQTRESHILQRLKQVFPRIPRFQIERFEFPDDPVHCMDLLWFMERYPLEMSKADERRIRGGKTVFERTQAELERIVQPDWTAPEFMGLRDGQTVRHYQAQAVEVALNRGSLLLGDDVGLGKTYTAIALALRPESLPMAIVVEPHLQVQWAEKIAEFCNLECHCVTKTTPYALPNVPIVIFRYSNLAGWKNELAKGHFKTVVYDEIQNLRTGSSTEKGNAARILSDHTTYQLGLSATPIFNYGSEIYAILSFLPGNSHQNPLGDYSEFSNEWLKKGSAQLKNADDLGSYLREMHLFLRRTKGDVGQEMDGVEVISVEVAYDEKEEKRVEDLAKTLAIKTLTGSFTERGSAARNLDMLMRHTTGVAKAHGVAHFVRMIAETGQQVLLAGWHRDFYAIILKELAEFKPCMYTGSESASQKQKAKQSFISGESRIMVISLRSGSGMDGIQQVCSTVVVGEFDWSPEVHKQLIGRVDREGQKNPVSAFFLHCDGGSDPAIVELLGLKASQIKGILDPNSPFKVVISNDNKIKALAIDYLKRHGIALPKTTSGDGQAAVDALHTDPVALEGFVESPDWLELEAEIRRSVLV